LKKIRKKIYLDNLEKTNIVNTNSPKHFFMKQIFSSILCIGFLAAGINNATAGNGNGCGTLGINLTGSYTHNCGGALTVSLSNGGSKAVYTLIDPYGVSHDLGTSGTYKVSNTSAIDEGYYTGYAASGTNGTNGVSCSVTPLKFYIYMTQCTGHKGGNTESELEPATANAFTVYPNPATNVINVAMPSSDNEGQVSILDITGRTVATTIVPANTTSAVQLDLSNVPHGMYMVKMNIDGATHVEKFVKD